MPSILETLEPTIGPELAGALEKRGFERLTSVQEAVLAPGLDGCDLRISSQTGSGKTVAIGFVLRDAIAEGVDEDTTTNGNVVGRDQRARPCALVVTPTRELAKQVEEELAWLYAPLRARVASVTGGGGYRDELRSFRAKPAIIVGTPGRLLDHLKRGTIDASGSTAIVLDEADRMLDLGFRDDLEAILGFAPPHHRTHLVSATFSREVRALADRVQKDAVAIEGTPLGTANLDIQHLVHLVQPKERLAAIINLLLENPGAPTLIFARTRAGVAELAETLANEGFLVAMLSGEMEQAERNRALAAFKRGNVDALVATDVAARGIDVQDVARVLHAELPDDPDAYTHRSGRTGRAGKKGTSSLLVTPSELSRATGLLARAKVRFTFAPIPAAESIRESRDERTFAELTADFVEGDTVDPRSVHLAERILGSPEPIRAVARLVALVNRRAHAEPRDVTPIAPPAAPALGARAPRGQGMAPSQGWVRFRVSWGQAHGADARRMTAMVCRRGKIEGRDIGAISVMRTSSVVEVSARVADDFERATAKPDPRDPRIHIRRWSDEPVHRAPEPPKPVPADRPSRAKPKERPSTREVAATPKERPSTREVAATPKERPSAREVAATPKERPSAREVAATPKERSSRAQVAPKPKPKHKGPPWRGHGGHGPPKRRRPS